MPKLRYAIAALFFAASVACLALWWRSDTRRTELDFPVPASDQMASITVIGSMFYLMPVSIDPGVPLPTDVQLSYARVQVSVMDILIHQKKARRISVDYQIVHFPLWYPALVFALAGVGVLRLRRQFSIRSALIGLAVVAALLGMVVAL